MGIDKQNGIVVLTRFHAKNFQSLKDVSVDLGKFTVVVGASSSGKSAFIRSLKTIVSNPRSSSFVTHGEKFASLTMETGTGATVLFEKGEGHGRYVVSREGEESLEFTKLGGDVPDAVSSALGILPVETGKQSLNFAGQFDRPYLLDETGSVVARVLGELTNVTKIFDAVREASRRKQNASSLMRTRSEDLVRLNLKKQQFVSLRGQLESVERAEELLHVAEDLSSRATRLRKLVVDIDIAESYLESSSSPVEVPDISVVLAARDRLDSYTSLISSIRAEADRVKRSAEALVLSNNSLDEKAAELRAVLVEAGTCPTCDQPIM